MTISHKSHTPEMYGRKPVVVVSLMLVGFLTACSDSSLTAEAVQPETTTATSQPSVSAAQLVEDSTNSVSLAQAVAAGVVAIPEPDKSNQPDLGAAEPLSAPAMTTDNNDSNGDLSTDSQTTEVQTNPDSNEATVSESEMPVIESESSETIELVESTTTTDTQTETSTDTNNVENATSETVEVTATDSNPDNNADNNADSSSIVTDSGLTTEPTNINGTVDTTQPQTQFSSHTTSGFTGEVLNDAIRITWEADPEARGYNVYKQAQYITSVFTNEFVDEDVYDRDYYYEIEAFDYSDTLYYIATGLTVSARTLGRTDPDQPLPNADLLKDYELVFSDEFNGNTLDASKWNTSYLWGTDLFINSEEQYYVDIVNDPDFGFNPFTFDGENLTINSIKTPPELSEKALNQPYLSGVITSYDAFKFTYGYVETRAKVMFGKGYWPAFWLLNAYYVDDRPEIDIMEFIGDNQDVVYHTYHYYDSEGALRSTKSEPTPGIDFTADFHTYAVEWLPNTIIFYIDGIEVHRIVDTKVSQQDMYVIANTALGGWWAGSPDETTPFPGHYVLDYIRVYQRTTPFGESLLLSDSTNVPFNDEISGQVLPNHRPSIEDWPEGYPDGL